MGTHQDLYQIRNKFSVSLGVNNIQPLQNVSFDNDTFNTLTSSNIYASIIIEN